VRRIAVLAEDGRELSLDELMWIERAKILHAQDAAA
jgi:hypothetical protein